MPDVQFTRVLFGSEDSCTKLHAQTPSVSGLRSLFTRRKKCFLRSAEISFLLY